MRKEVVIQSELKDCAAACLGSIIIYYGGYIPQASLKEMLTITVQGTTAYSLVETARKIGFDSKGVQCEFSYLMSGQIKLPVIAHVQIYPNVFHYVVIYKIDQNKKVVHIMDPIEGKKVVSCEAFTKIYHQVLILLYPIQQLPIYENQSIYKSCIKYIKPHLKKMMIILLLSFLFILFNILTSFYFQYIIDMLEDIDTLYWVTLCLGIVIGMILLTDYLRNKMFIYINKTLDKTLFLNTVKHLILLPYHYFKNHTTGDIMMRIQDLHMIRNSFTELLMLIFIDCFLALFSIGFLYSLQKELCIFIVIVVLLYAFVVWSCHPKLKNCIYRNKIAYADASSLVLESLQGYETIKGLHKEQYIFSKIENKYQAFTSSYELLAKLNQRETLLKNIIYYIGSFGVLFLGGILILNEKITAGTLMTFSVILGYFLEPIRNILDFEFVLKDASIALKRIHELFQLKEEMFYLGDIQWTNSMIKIKNLSFSYQDIVPILNNITVDFIPGKHYLLIGESGSGKSTLVKLLMKYYEVPEGMIEIGGHDIGHYATGELRAHVTYVSQNEILFSDTLWNNLKISNQDLKQIEEVCKLVYVKEHQIFHKDMLIEENGFNLSGGERQRIILARALLQNKDVVILDESLNEIHIDMERKIIKNIFSKYPGVTFIVISHRMDNMDLYDTVVRFRKGGVELLNK